MALIPDKKFLVKTLASSHFMDIPSDHLTPFKGRPVTEATKRTKRRMVMVTLNEFLLKPVPKKPPSFIESEEVLRHTTRGFLAT